MVGDRAEAVMLVLAVAVGLALGVGVTEFGLPVVSDLGIRPYIPGTGFVALVLFAIAGLAPLIAGRRRDPDHPDKGRR